MPDYSRGKIYKIVCNETGLIYVGSTCEPTLARRLAKHVKNFKSWKKDKTNFVTSFKIIENSNYDIVLLESCPCESKDELYKRERYYIENLECVNKIITGRTPLEYYQQNKETIINKAKEYRIKNKEIIKTTRSQVFLCECGKTFTPRHKARHQKSKFHQDFINNIQNKV
jgi:Uri superfamily endonuclease